MEASAVGLCYTVVVCSVDLAREATARCCLSSREDVLWACGDLQSYRYHVHCTRCDSSGAYCLCLSRHSAAEGNDRDGDRPNCVLVYCKGFLERHYRCSGMVPVPIACIAETCKEDSDTHDSPLLFSCWKLGLFICYSCRRGALPGFGNPGVQRIHSYGTITSMVLQCMPPSQPDQRTIPSSNSGILSRRIRCLASPGCALPRRGTVPTGLSTYVGFRQVGVALAVVHDEPSRPGVLGDDAPPCQHVGLRLDRAAIVRSGRCAEHLSRARSAPKC